MYTMRYVIRTLFIVLIGLFLFWLFKNYGFSIWNKIESVFKNFTQFIKEIFSDFSTMIKNFAEELKNFDVTQ